MLSLRRSEERGHADHGWLDAHHTFSFADYHDPDWMGFGPLWVLNQDRVAPGQGFAPHDHHDMEIVTWVLEGTLQHRDSMGHGSLIRAGEVQFMSAGTGVTHSEMNPSPDTPVHLLQMWVRPARRATSPRYGQRAIPAAARRGRLALAVSPDGRDGSLPIGRDASLFVGLFDGDESARHALAPRRLGWLHVARGEITANGEPLGPGDGLGLTHEAQLEVSAGRDAEVVFWDLPDA